MNSPVDIYISLGSNINPVSSLASAREDLFEWLDHGQISPVYQSPPVGMIGADFLNAVVSGSTSQPLQPVIDKLLAIELAHGRIRTENKFSDRTLDLDLLIYGDLVCGPDSPVVLPHSEIVQQAYVLQPLADLAGDLIHPGLNCTIKDLCTRLKAEAPEKFQALTQIALN